jgi:hypothetical protein
VLDVAGCTIFVMMRRKIWTCYRDRVSFNGQHSSTLEYIDPVKARLDRGLSDQTR